MKEGPVQQSGADLKPLQAAVVKSDGGGERWQERFMEEGFAVAS
jgi:hypothetical protein